MSIASPPMSAPPVRIHVAHLDGLRAFALLWVMFGHMIIFGGNGPVPYLRGIAGAGTAWLYYVHFAVDIFIVLSGYCLIIPVMGGGSLPGGALLFFKKRARRILPPFYAGLVVSLLLDILGHHLPFFTLRTFVVNALLLQDLAHAQNVVNGAFWSIALEWRIYFLFPAIVYVLGRFGRKAALLVTALAGYGIAIGFHVLDLFRHDPTYWYTSPWYLFLFTLGVCAGSVAHDRRRPPTLPALRTPLIFCALVTGLPLAFVLWAGPISSDYAAYVHLWPLHDALVGGLTATFLVWLGLDSGQRRPHWPTRLLAWRPLVFLGSFSYSAYLIHLPLIFLLLRAVLQPHHLGPEASVLCLFFLGTPLILAVSYLFFLAFERPFLNTRRRETPAETARDAALSPAP